MLIDKLKKLQSEAGYLHRERLLELSRRESIPLYQIEAVVSFYPHFRSTPPPALEVAICGDMSCYLSGAERLEAEVRRYLEELAVKGDAAVEFAGSDGGTVGATPEGAPRIEFRRVSCVGLCDRAPACAFNDEPEGDVTFERVRGFLASELEAYRGRGGRGAGENGGDGATDRSHADDDRSLVGRGGEDRASPDPGGARGTAARARAGAPSHDPAGDGESSRPGAAREVRIDPHRPESPYAALRELLRTSDADGALARIKASGLRGLGGAGFPTGTKWEFTRNAAGSPKYVICNADESEPGTFKDRDVLERFPHLVLEGMLIGARVVGASRATLFLRHEYHLARERVERAIAELAALGLAGENIAGSGFSCEIELFVSAGGYICGEETALLEALEGKRAEPRNKPPFPGVVGLHGRPTLINNVETFAMIPGILARGPDWFRSFGENGGVGLKYFALSGHVNRPGVYEAWLGIPARKFILEQGGGMRDGRGLKAFAPGGASSGFLPASLADLPLDFKPLADAGSMLGTGAVVAVGEGTCMLDLALNVVRFFRNESCGKCVPCREGTEELVRILERIRAGRGKPRDLELVDELSDTMARTSICGLGQAAPLPITSVIRHWRDEVDAHVVGGRCPEGVCR